MKKRGETYRNWCDPILHHQVHEETLDDGTRLEVQTRLSRTGATQLFIGVYLADGTALYERAYARRPGETMSRARGGGVGRARRVAAEREATQEKKLELALRRSGKTEANAARVMATLAST